MSIHPCEYIHIHRIFMNTSKKLGQIDLEIYEVGQKVSHCRRGRRLPLKND
jgi:hypothetical protein